MTPDEVLDLTGVPCPRNAARALLALETLDGGEILMVTLDHGEPIENVPPSLVEEGHEVVERRRLDDGRWVLFVRAA